MYSPAMRRVVSPFLALRPSNEAGAFVVLSSGTVIETSTGDFGPGLRSVRVEGEELLVFNRDIQERTEEAAMDECAPNGVVEA